jgi:hypothetical protein
MSVATAGDAHFAAVLFGVVEAVRSATGIRPPPADEASEIRVTALVKSHLGEAGFRTAFEDGSGPDMSDACRLVVERIGSREIHGSSSSP